jgi:rfaE bifunctional protein kinase chain/domain
LERHGFNFDQLTSLVESFSKLRVVVVGDLIVDEFIDCDPLGMSREDPTLVVTPIEQARFVGGAGVVAAHAAGFGADVSYFGVIGKDDTAQFASEQLAHEGVKAWFVVDESRPTTLKQRFRAQEKTLLRVSYLRQRSISTELAGVLAAKIESQLDGVDLLIFSDFNYGCLPQGLVDRIIAACQRKGIAMMADSQSSSQIGDISRFKGMQLVTPTETEARIALRDHSSGLVPIAEALCRKACADHVFITLGSEGMLIYGRDGSADGAYVTDQLPAFNSAPKDLAGAGDSLLACASMALVAGGSVWQSAYLGSLAASCQVARLGNSPLTAAELLTELRL